MTRGQEPKNGWEEDRVEKGGAMALVGYYGGVVVVRLEGVDEAAGTPKNGWWMDESKGKGEGTGELGVMMAQGLMAALAVKLFNGRIGLRRNRRALLFLAGGGEHNTARAKTMLTE